MAGDITGVVYLDANANGIDDPAENGLPGWTVFVDTNGDGRLNSGEPSTITDVKGRYALVGLPAGPTTVYEVLEPEFSPTPGFSDHQTISVRDGREVRVKFPNVTAPVTTGQVHGTVYEDLNENGIKESGEDGFEGWTLFLDMNGDGALTAGEPTTTSDTNGDYLFAGVPTGNVTIYAIPQGGFAPIAGGLFPLQGALDHYTVTVTAGDSIGRDFGNLIPPVGTIRGAVWNDANGDGIRAVDDAGLAGRTVFIDLNGNGIIDASEPTRTTGADGTYSFVDIHTGVYRVVEVMPEGWISTEGRSNSVLVSVGRGAAPTVDFLNLQPLLGSVAGVVWNDLDGNGTRGAVEPGISGWTVYLDANGNSLLDASERSAMTDANGEYRFEGVSYGTLTIREVVPADWLAIQPATASRSFRLLNSENRSAVDFGVRERIGTIQGTVRNDADGDRVVDAGETGLADWTVFLDLDGDSTQDPAEPSTITDSSGAYRFTRVPVGVYRVVEVMQDGWISSLGTSSATSVSVVIGGTHTVDFQSLQPVLGTLSGTVFSDLDSNGVQSVAEAGLSDWLVYVDANANGVFDAGEPSATTDSLGAYTIEGVAYGNTIVREQVATGFTPTNHPGGVFSTLVLNGENRTGVNFGNHEIAEFVISGIVFKDTNLDGVRDADEPGLSGVTLYLDMNDNGTLDAGEPSTASSVDLFYTPAVNEVGTYSFTHLARGAYSVREIVTPELEKTPLAARQQVAVVGPANASEVNFASVYRDNEIHGIVFDDTDGDGVQGSHERGRSGVSVYIDLDRDDSYDVDEPRTVTGDDGSYAFIGLTPGAYVVREEGGVLGPHTYPTTGGGVLWPEGANHPTVGNVSPSSISTSLANGETYQQTVSLTLPAAGSLADRVDVFLLFDDTGSFTGNSPIVRAAFPTIISTLQAALPGTDLGFGVGRFEEYGSFALENSTGRPFILNQPIVASSTAGFSTAIQAALDRMAPGYGGDGSETDIEALYQLVTGRGFDGNNNGSVLDSGLAGLAATQLSPGASGDVPNFASFTPDAANNVLPAAGNVGGGGFRNGALPIVLLATDIGFAYQPKGETTIVGAGGVTLPVSALTQNSRPSTPFNAGAGLQETVTGLNALGALVIGLGTNVESTIDPRQGLESLATLTGAVNRSTSTIANGTLDPIAPGDPLYFQISSGFGSNVADGVVNAIQNAATNVALDITVRASDPRVRIINHTGTLFGVGSGQTASFDIEFVGDGRPHRFDLEFVREGANVVVGSIPVEIGTPIVGEGYNYDELEDGEIHRSSHFGNYVANQAPSFVGGADQTVLEDSGVQTITAWATNIVAGPASESAQVIDFQVSNDNPSLFSASPTISSDGTLTFTPAPNAHGTAVVTVAAHDNGGVGFSGVDTSATQTFVISIEAVNDAPSAVNDNYTMFAGETLQAVVPGVLANDSDVDGDSLTATLTTSPAHGTLVLNSDGSFDYIPTPGYSGADSFSYSVNDGAGGTSEATVAIDIQPRNSAPVASDDAYSILEDGTLNIAAAGVLDNDHDVDGDSLALSLVSGPAHGSLTLNADGSFQYTPAANFNGVDQFTYLLNDGAVDSNLATVTITVASVNDTPVASDNTYAATEDAALNIAVSGVLTNDSDADGDTLTASLVSSVSHGELSLNSNGSFSYTPAANFYGVDSFTYQVSDGSATSAVATVTINVASVNDAPVAVGETYNATEDTTLTIALPGLLANDSDVDGDVLRAVRVTGPTRGALVLNANGSFTYTPNVNFNGSDSFTYRANDGLLDSNTVTVSIQVAAVNDVPVAVADAYSTNQDTALNVPARGLLTNDVDADGETLTAILASGPAHGTVSLNGDGSFLYTPATGYSGADNFTYRAADASSSSTATTVNINVVAAVPATKFFVVDADNRNKFRYAASGTALGASALDKSDSKPRGVASSADGTTQWVIDGSGEVFIYNEAGALLGRWTPQNVGKPEGITVWGNNLWIVDPTQDRVFFFSGGASLRAGRVNATSSFALNSGNLNSTDIVTDGAHLWVVNDVAAGDKVFRYTTAGALEGSWTLSTTNPSPTGITLDPTSVNHLWVVDASTDRVYQYDGATARLTGAQEPSIAFQLATTNTNPQGIADPLPASSSLTSAAAESTLRAARSASREQADDRRSSDRSLEVSDDRLTDSRGQRGGVASAEGAERLRGRRNDDAISALLADDSVASSSVLDAVAARESTDDDAIDAIFSAWDDSNVSRRRGGRIADSTGSRTRSR